MDLPGASAAGPTLSMVYPYTAPDEDHARYEVGELVRMYAGSLISMKAWDLSPFTHCS